MSETEFRMLQVENDLPKYGRKCACCDGYLKWNERDDRNVCFNCYCEDFVAD